MKLRKINAGLSLLTSLLLLAHAISIAVWLFSGGRISEPGGFLAWTLTGAAAVHALICFCFVVCGFKNRKNGKDRSYLRMNIPTLVQRISGAMLIIFTGLHIAGATGYMQPPKAVHAVVPPLFFIMSLAHVSVSASKAFITLGIGDAQLVKKVSIAAKIICGATLIADITGFYLYLV